MAPFVSVVVPTFNRHAGLRRLLEALAEQSCPRTGFEVIVVDDGSGDGTPAFARALALPYALTVVEQAHQGPGAARNRGVEVARGPLILFLDDDVVPLADVIDAHVDTHLREAGVAVIGPMLPPLNWKRPPWVRWEEELLQVQYRELMDGKYPCTPRQFFTANASVSRASFLAAGGFNPALARAEDVEFAYRLRDQGVGFRFDPRARVRHYAWRSFAAWCNAAWQYGRSDALMQRDRGQEALEYAAYEFHRRHPLTRLLVRGCVGRRWLRGASVRLLRGVVEAAERLAIRQIAWPSLSAIFNLLYWQGMYDELGGLSVRHALDEGRGIRWRSAAIPRARIAAGRSSRTG